MATIQKRETSKGTVYRVQVRLAGHPAQTKSFARLTDAKRWSASVESSIREGRHRFETPESRRRTFAEAMTRYKREFGFSGDREGVPRGRHSRLSRLDWWEGRLGPYLLSEITPDHIREAMAELAGTEVRGGGRMSPTTISHYCAAVSHVFGVAAKEWQWLDRNPCSLVRRPKLPTGRVRFLDDTERKKLLDACRASRCEPLYDIVLVGLCTGCRQSEILTLRWADVDLERGLLMLQHTKNGERRSVPLAGPALAALRERFEKRREGVDLVFPGPRRKNGPIQFKASWARAVEVAGLADFRFHDLRHTTASYLAMSGASLAEIGEVLGHKTLQMVRRYSHLSTPHVAGVVGRMVAGVFAEGGTNGEA